MSSLLGQTFFVFSVVFSRIEVTELSKEKTLIKKLLNNYQEIGVMGRPVVSQNDVLNVQYGLSLIQILDLDERNQVLKTNVWATYHWKDIYMSWDPLEYDNITKVRVPMGSIWQPDIKLYNYADERREEKREALLVVSHDGGIQWIPQAIFRSSCAIDIMYFPFDVQTCKMKFGSWTYDGYKIDLDLVYNVSTGFEMTDYIKSNEWEIISSRAKKTVFRYACCDEPFVDLTFHLKIKRQPAFYNYILILPCILLSSLTLVLFWLPPESPAKMQLGMNIFVAFFVLLLLLAESTPPAASSIPLIGAYYCLNMILITLSTFLSVIVVNLYFRGSRTEVPKCVKTLFVNGFARILCMKGQVSYNSCSTDNSRITNNINMKNREKRFKYDKVGYFETQTEDSWKPMQNGIQNTDDEPCPPIPTSISQTLLSSVEQDVKEIRNHLQRWSDKTEEKEMKERITREWRIVALVLDRLFFCLYLLVIIVSICTAFHRAIVSLFNQQEE
ncbi:neuronal acetylcholine receptor subunit beta-3-like [Mytilus edulis]|uniref:neuronal acetylcholine receptor subunit beta-3-like n=1 Tax=Mytilus edulis TaxID=6550 RepID=UPI0039F0364A